MVALNMRRLCSAFALAVAMAGQVQAAETTPRPKVIGSWLILGGDNSCALEADYERGLRVFLQVNPELKKVIVAFQHERWRSAPHLQTMRLEIQFLASGDRWSGTGTIINDPGLSQPTLAMHFEPGNFAEDWRTATGFVLRADGEEIGRYTLKGSAAAYDYAKACADRQWAATQAKRASQARSLALAEAARSLAPANPPVRPTYPPGSPIPILNPSAWVSTEDWPSAALREGREGVVAYTLDIGTDGLPIACAITLSSGHTDLDETTCTVLMRRARFEPGKDGKGNPVRAVFTGRMRWQIP